MRRLIYVDGEPAVKQNKRCRQMTLEQRKLSEFCELEVPGNEVKNGF